MSGDWMIYGANGYTGALIAREAARRGLKPVLAGRDRARIEALAAELGLQHRVFALGAPAVTAQHLRDIALVLHCAGPFSATAAPMMAACLLACTHYLDITGEIDVFEHAQSLDRQAREAGIVLCPGVGFDVIPTDCVAAALKQALPDATTLALGFDTRSRLSPGTARTTVEGLALGGRIRRGGRIVSVPLAHETRRIDFGHGEKLAMAIAWGDVSTAFHSTGIPDISVFVPTSPRTVRAARVANFLRPVLRMPGVQRVLKRRIGNRAIGPDAEQRERSPSFVWGEARNAAGQRRTARIRTANGYALTVTGSLAVAQHVLDTAPAGGAYTPSGLAGADLVQRLPGSGPLVID
ncbi:saccharopine dehydrogenase NADP-binding domain-containing protein [Acetobacteraceae bacterium KSS8]|uniref:Saccharopine dehydrogenase NADP-binding domain-containing protein n=1 Tax=Endosaccharibacter trunci TaxID=2812733 RepID=A0ABT1W6T5_9PROT|nr:saccharopine dehydrogenase NADP-binding domain-containing protein [Acetobacteraceae bacterium KSS8]